MNPYSKIIFLIISIVFLSLQGIGQESTLKGTIKDPKGEPIPGVAIYLEAQTSKGTVSNAQGEFVLKVNSGDKIGVIFKGIGGSEKKEFFQLAPGQIKDFEIIYDNALTGKIIEITEKISDGITFRTLEIKLPTKLPVLNQGIEAYLIQAAVNIPSELSSSYSVRGGSFDENLVYVNEIQVYRPFLVRAGQQEGLSFPNPDMVNQIWRQNEFCVGYHLCETSKIFRVVSSGYVGNTIATRRLQ
jgi:CarboxypepD_reg-like domain